MTRFSIQAEGAALALPWSSVLNTRVDGLFRLDAHAQVATLDAAGKIAFLAEEAILQISFQARQVDILAESGLGSVASHAAGLRVDLDPILPLRAVSVDHPNRLGVFRLDGQALAAAATTQLRAAPERASKPGGDPRNQTDKQDKAPALPGKKPGKRELVPEQPFTGAPFVLSPQTDSLAVADLKSLRVEAAVAGPRLGLARADQPDEVAFFWHGEGAGTFQLGRELAEAANRLAAAQAGSGPLHFRLVIAADTPCAVVVQQLSLPYGLAVPLLPSAEKLEVRFEGRQHERVALALPPWPAGRVAQAELVVDAQLTGLAGTATAWPTGLKTGVLVDTDAWTATAFMGPGITVHGLQLGLRAHALPARLEVALREDHGGMPSGRVLTRFALDLATAPSHWFNAPFPEPLLLEAKALWLLLRAASGQVTWLLADGAGPSGRYSEDGGGTPARARLTLANQRGLFGWQSNAGEAPIHELSLNDQVLAPNSIGKDRYRYDLRPALPTSEPATLVLSSSAKGKLILYPGEVLILPQ